MPMSMVVNYGTIIFISLIIWLVGFSVTLGLDTYTDKKRKQFYGLIIVLVFLHIMQNYLEYWVVHYHPADTWRTVLSVFGYSIRPVILATFAHMLAPNKKHIAVWGLVIVNFLMHLTAFWTLLVFKIDNNTWVGGPLRYWCLVTSAILLGYLVFLTIRKYQMRKADFREILFHLFWITLIVAGIIADLLFNNGDQWADYLTISMTCGTVLSYIWLHQQFVKDYEVNFAAEQRMRMIISQIQPHFLYNTLTSIRNIEGNPPETRQAITEFANYIRGNLAVLDGSELIPFAQEIELVKDYVALQQRRFVDRFQIDFDITDEDYNIPPLTVQLLVENAIKHGIVVRYDPGLITIRSVREGKYHILTVTDNGVGFDTDILQTTDRVGLRAVRNRLEYFLDATIDIQSEIGNGTKVTIRIPIDPPKTVMINKSNQ